MASVLVQRQDPQRDNLGLAKCVDGDWNLFLKTPSPKFLSFTIDLFRLRGRWVSADSDPAHHGLLYLFHSSLAFPDILSCTEAASS